MHTLMVPKVGHRDACSPSARTGQLACVQLALSVLAGLQAIAKLERDFEVQRSAPQAEGNQTSHRAGKRQKAKSSVCPERYPHRL